MRKLVVFLFAVAIPALCLAQTPTNRRPPDDLKIVGATFRQGTSRVRNSTTDSKNSSLLGPDGQTNRPAADPGDQGWKNDLARARGNGQLGPLPDNTFLLQLGRSEAIVNIRNDGIKAVKAISYNFLFVNANNGRELLRYHFRNRVAIGPGETKMLTNAVVDQRARDFNPNVIGSKTSSFGVVETRVEITRIEYADGSVWRSR